MSIATAPAAASAHSGAEAEIDEVKVKIKEVEDELKVVKEALAIPDGVYLRMTGEELKIYLNKLMRKEEQLREDLKEAKLERQQPAGISVVTDQSWMRCRTLMSTTLRSLPAINELAGVLATPPAARLPVQEPIMGELTRKGQQAAHLFEADNGPMYELALCLTNALNKDLYGMEQEPFTLIAVQTCIIDILLTMDKLLGGTDLQLGLIPWRDRGDKGSLMTLTSSTGKTLRPDGMLHTADGRMLFKWEEKGASSLEKPIDELGAKTAVWTPLYYGTLPYLLCFAAAGPLVQFCAVERSAPGRAIPVGPVHNLVNLPGRAQLVIAAVNLYRLLGAAKQYLPSSVLPVGRDLVQEHLGFKRTLHFVSNTMTVRKRIAPWSAYAQAAGVDHETIQQVYRFTAEMAGLVHSVDPGTQPSLQVDKYTVDLAPLGLQAIDALPTSEEQLAMAAHGLLHGLLALHQAGFVHRDLRWPNCACDASKQHYFLLDLEMCATADAVPRGTASPHWDGHTLVDGRYTKASDLYGLGRLLQEHSALCQSRASSAFLRALCTPAADQRKTAAQYLSERWINCPGSMCTAAGAMPSSS